MGVEVSGALAPSSEHTEELHGVPPGSRPIPSRAEETPQGFANTQVPGPHARGFRCSRSEEGPRSFSKRPGGGDPAGPWTALGESWFPGSWGQGKPVECTCSLKTWLLVLLCDIEQGTLPLWPSVFSFMRPVGWSTKVATEFGVTGYTLTAGPLSLWASFPHHKRVQQNLLFRLFGEAVPLNSHVRMSHPGS